MHVLSLNMNSLLCFTELINISINLLKNAVSKIMMTFIMINEMPRIVNGNQSSFLHGRLDS